MTQEEKQLLLKDLCARLPYGVEIKCEASRISVTLSPHILGVIVKDGNELQWKPYLRSMSSMTEEELAEWEFPLDMDYNGYCIPAYPALDWLLAHHFDFRGLIEKGLALEAPEGMYKNE